jgi:hypothetical protein
MILFIISHFQGIIKIFFKHIPLPPQILPLGNGDEGAKNESTPTPVKAGGVLLSPPVRGGRIGDFKEDPQ